MGLYPVVTGRHPGRRYIGDPVLLEVPGRLIIAARWTLGWAHTPIPEVVVAEEHQIRAALQAGLPEHNPS